MSRTAEATVPARPAGSSARRTLAVLRICSVNWPAGVAWPWGILASAFALNLVIFAVLPESDDGSNTTGGLLSIYVVVAICFLQLFTQFLPFLLGLGVTRYRFAVSVALGALAQALVYGVALTGFDALERATGGWGLDLHFFGVPFMSVTNPLVQVLVFAGPFLLFAAAGAGLGIVWARWGQQGMYVLLLALLLLVGAAVFLLTRAQAWTSFGQWFADRSATALFVGWPVLIAVVLAAAGFAVVRRTPG